MPLDQLDLMPDEKPAVAAEAVGTPAKGRGPRRRWLRWAAAFCVVAVLGFWMAWGPVTTRIETNLMGRLQEQGIYLRYAQRSWSFWRGLRLEKVVLSRDAEGRQPAVELSALAASFPWIEIVVQRTFVSRWRIDDATLVLYDGVRSDVEPLRFEHVSTRILARADRVEIPRVAFEYRGFSANLTGKALFVPDPEHPSPQRPPLEMDLGALRGVLGTMNFQGSKKVFAIQGTYVVNGRGEAVDWKGDLTGAGQSVSWQGVPFREASAKAQLTSADFKMTTILKMDHGSADLAFSRTDWAQSPLTFSGRLSDAAGQSDDCAGRYEASDETGQTVIFRTLDGPANLWDFARNIPALAPAITPALQFQKFPRLAARDLAWTFGKALPSTGSVALETPADFTYAIGGEPLKIEALEGRGNFAEKESRLQLKTGPLTWQGWKTRSSQIDATFAATFKSAVSVQLASGSAKLDLSRTAKANAPLEFTGSLTDTHEQSDRLSGAFAPDAFSLRLARLEGRANLLELLTNVPGWKPVFPGGARVKTFPEIAIKDLVYRPGQPVTFGGLRIVSPADLTVDFQGKPMEIGGLTGAIASDGKSWQLSGVKGEAFGGSFALDGNYDNGTLRRGNIALTQFHVNQLDRSLGSEQAALGEALLTLEYHGTMSSEPAQLNGTGRVHLDNAPVVQVPLLDQTYAIFSVLSSAAKRHGAGSLSANFTAKNGVATVDQFVANSEAVKVTADGTIDLVQRKVTGRASGNLRGLIGVVTSPLTNTLEMEVSGPLDDIRVRPIGFGGIVKRSLKGGAAILPDTAKESGKLTGDLIQNGLTLPLKTFDLFRTRPEK